MDEEDDFIPHKKKNTFKFQTFHERIANVHIDAARKLTKFATTPEDADTFFSEALLKWRELNLTRSFADFQSDIRGEVHTLTQLLHHKNTIIDALQRHLAIPDSLAYQPLLDLVVQLARDLQVDFYPHFESFLKVIVGLLESCHHDPEVLEFAFTTLAYLFKFLWRYMIKDMHNVYRLFSPLLSSTYRTYIVNFAAESFSFLMRKEKNPTELFDFMFAQLQQHPDQSAGVGRLLFEMLRGVRKQFHSCATKVLPILLRCLHDAERGELIHSVLSDMWKSMTSYTDGENCEVVWEAMLNTIKEVHVNKETSSEEKSLHLNRILCLCLILLDKWDGVLLKKPSLLVQGLMALLRGETLSDECGQTLLKVLSCLLLAPRCILNLQDRPRLLSLAFESKYSPDVIYQFARDIFGLALFEKDALALILAYCQHAFESLPASALNCVALLNDLLLDKVAPNLDVSVACGRQTYVLDFRSACKKQKTKSAGSLSAWMLQRLVTITEQSVTSWDMPLAWSLVHCLPHCKPLDEELCEKTLTSLIKKMHSDLAGSQKLHSLALLNESAISLCQLLENSSAFVAAVPSSLVMDTFSTHPNDVYALRLLDLYLTVMKESSPHSSLLSEASFTKLYDSLKHNLASPQHQIRLLSLHILSLFELKLREPPPDVVVEQRGVFSICLSAEQTPITLHTYREHLSELSRLEQSIVNSNLPVGAYDNVALRYLLGVLYINLTVMWKPIIKLICSYGTGLHGDDFWEVMVPMIDDAAAKSELVLRQKNKEGEEALDEEERVLGQDEAITQIFNRFCSYVANKDERVDHVNYRRLLWKALSDIPAVCEPRSDVICKALFKFLKNEYYLEDAEIAPYQDISRSNPVEDDLNLTADSQVLTPGGKKKKPKRASNQTLVNHLKVFSKFTRPKSVAMEPQLRELYMQLLLHRDDSVQLVALQCLLTYREKFLMPYRERLEGLLDEKKLKDELVQFGIDEDCSVVQPDHRMKLIPILMRILYGRMMNKTGKDTTGKGKTHLRKNLIMRFLAGSRTEEIAIFLDLLFEPFAHYVSDDLNGMVDRISNETDITRVIPLGKQQGVLETIEVVLNRLNRVLDEYETRLLHIITSLNALICTVFTKRDEISPFNISLLKHMRVKAQMRMNEFFIQREDYKYTSNEVNAIFKAVLWPQLPRLKLEGTHSPTPILKILLTFSEIPRYLPLLAKCHEDDPTLTPLPYLFELLLAKAVQPSVTAVIMEMIRNMLALDDEQDEEFNQGEVLPIDVGRSCHSAFKSDVPLGTQILMPHVMEVIQYLKVVTQNLAKVRVKKPKLMPMKEVNILSHISRYVTDEQQCSEVILLILPFLSRKVQRVESIELDLLVTALHLMKNAANPQQFLAPMAPLYISVTNRLSRSELCKVLQVIGERDSRYAELADVVSKINAWDLRRLDEPDFVLRIKGFDAIQSHLQNAEQSLHYFQMIVANCFHFLATVDDIALRERASHTLNIIVKSVAKQRENKELFNLIIRENILTEVRVLIKSDNETVRHEILTLLGVLVEHFPECPEIADLNLLRNPEDVEVDFFANIVHIQLTRRSKALIRLSKLLETTPVKTSVLVHYLMPICTTILNSDAYTKHTFLLDAAIEAMEAVCRGLTWSQYSGVLRRYLALLSQSITKQKLMVRVLAAVLNAFHFDLSRSTEVNSRFSSKVIDEQKNAEEQVEEEEEEEEEEVKEEEADVEEGSHWVIKCDVHLASRIHLQIAQVILPQLYASLTQKAKTDDAHKKAGVSKYAEDDEILRVPLAIAMVRLLQHLPATTLMVNLPSVLLRVCHFLRSRSQDIRDVARSTLLKILQALGNSYLFYIVKEMCSALTKGYQLHVLSFTVWHLLSQVEDTLQSGDVDSSVALLVQVFNEELFGQVAEEKEVKEANSGIFEAKKSKSYDAYCVLATFISADCLHTLINPLKLVLETTNSYKNVNKATEAMNKIGEGLSRNSGVELAQLMTFIYRLIDESLPLLWAKKSEKKEAPPPDPRLKPPSTFLLKKEAPRGGVKSKTFSKTNMHVMVEFGLKLLHLLFKRDRITGRQQPHLQMLDPFVEVLAQILTCKHSVVITCAIRCLIKMFKMPVPSLRQHIATITNRLFVLVSQYAGAGTAKGDNAMLLTSTFKALTILVKNVDYHQISNEQLEVLLGYAEVDIHDHMRQAVAFNLLKAVISRKFSSDGVTGVIKKLLELSIQSDSQNVRLQSRQVVLHYLLDYPLGNELTKHLEFYIIHLEYQSETGRQSALEMMATLFETFPLKILKRYSALFFVPLASRLVNEASTKCCELVALALKALLKKLNDEDRDKLLEMCLKWMTHKTFSIRRMSLMALGLFVEVENTSFERHLEKLLPHLKLQIQPEKYAQSEEDSENENVLRGYDRQLHQLLTLLLKLCRECSIHCKPKWGEDMKEIWLSIEQHLTHPHAWVRLVSAQLVGFLFGSLDPKEIADNVMQQKKGRKRKYSENGTSGQLKDYWTEDPVKRLSVLCDGCAKQFASPDLPTEHADQVIKNLVFLAKVLKHLPDEEEVGNPEPSAEELEETEAASLVWLIGKMCREARYEAAKKAKTPTKRSCVLKWMAALAIDLGRERLQTYLPLLLQPIIREFTVTNHAIEELKALSGEVLDLIKATVGVEVFSREYASANQKLLVKRAERKRERAMEAITNPELFAKRKVKKNLASAKAKKRKMQERLASKGKKRKVEKSS